MSRSPLTIPCPGCGGTVTVYRAEPKARHYPGADAYCECDGCEMTEEDEERVWEAVREGER